MGLQKLRNHFWKGESQNLGNGYICSGAIFSERRTNQVGAYVHNKLTKPVLKKLSEKDRRYSRRQKENVVKKAEIPIMLFV